MLRNKSPEFKEANKVSLKIAEEIERVLKFNGLASLITIVNSMSLSLKLPSQFKQRNSTLAVNNKGGGKSTLLIHILAKSNPKFFQILPKKMFESELIDKDHKYFHNKILIHDDIIAAIGGMSKKQREQLIGFFTLLLSDGHYSRDGKVLDGIDCLSHFGIAMESFIKHRKDLIEATFLDRFATYRVRLTHQLKADILRHRDGMFENNIQLPKIKLPLTKSKKTITFDLEQSTINEINRLALELDMYNVISSTRAQSYIRIFMLSNALLNGRATATKYDLELYQLLHPYHLESSYDMSKKHKIIATLRANPGITVSKIQKLTGIPESTLYRLLKNLRVEHPELSQIIT